MLLLFLIWSNRSLLLVSVFILFLFGLIGRCCWSQVLLLFCFLIWSNRSLLLVSGFVVVVVLIWSNRSLLLVSGFVACFGRAVVGVVSFPGWFRCCCCCCSSVLMATLNSQCAERNV